MLTLGLDLSTKCTGMALVGGAEVRAKAVNNPGLAGIQRLQLIADEIDRTIGLWQPDLVVIERFTLVHKASIDSYTRLVEISTMVRLGLYKRNIPWVLVSPSTLKKWTTGSGKAEKVEMAISVCNRWDFMSKSHDIIDAFALAQMGQLGLPGILAISGVQPGS